MLIYYKYNENIYKMSVKSFIDINNYSNIKLEKSLKTSLKRVQKTNIDDYLISNYNKKLELCGFCNHYSIYKIIFSLEKYKKSFIITDIDLEYDKFYCKGKNNNCEGKKLNPNSVKFVSLSRRLNNEDALKYIHNRNKSPFYLQNHIDKDSYIKYQTRDMDFFENDVNKYNKWINNIKYGHSINNYIDKYGEEEGRKIFKEIGKKKDTSSLSYFIKKNNGDENIALVEFNDKNEKCKQTLENFIKRYGDCGHDMYMEYNTNRNKICTLEYQINLYGQEEGYKRYIESSIKKQHSLYNFIRLYGEEEGIIKYEKFIKNKKGQFTKEWFKNKYGEEHWIQKREEWLVKISNNNTNNTTYSIESFKIFQQINNYLKLDGYFGENEYFLRKDGNIFFYDYTLLKEKIIIEYNGKIWHPNLENMNEDDFNNWKNPYNKDLQAIDVYNRDILKINVAKEMGFDVLIIWDYEKNKKEKIINFIKNKINKNT